jgi:hypothetical protein
VLITKDQHIRKKLLEGAAYAAAKLRGFVVTGKDMSGNELGDLLVRCLDGMVRRTAGRTLLFTISRAGSFGKLI